MTYDLPFMLTPLKPNKSIALDEMIELNALIEKEKISPSRRRRHRSRGRSESSKSNSKESILHAKDNCSSHLRNRNNSCSDLRKSKSINDLAIKQLVSTNDKNKHNLGGTRNRGRNNSSGRSNRGTICRNLSSSRLHRSQAKESLRSSNLGASCPDLKLSEFDLADLFSEQHSANHINTKDEASCPDFKPDNFDFADLFPEQHSANHINRRDEEHPKQKQKVYIQNRINENNTPTRGSTRGSQNIPPQKVTSDDARKVKKMSLSNSGNHRNRSFGYEERHHRDEYFRSPNLSSSCQNLTLEKYDPINLFPNPEGSFFEEQFNVCSSDENTRRRQKENRRSDGKKFKFRNKASHDKSDANRGVSMRRQKSFSSIRFNDDDSTYSKLSASCHNLSLDKYGLTDLFPDLDGELPADEKIKINSSIRKGNRHSRHRSKGKIENMESFHASNAPSPPATAAVAPDCDKATEAKTVVKYTSMRRAQSFGVSTGQSPKSTETQPFIENKNRKNLIRQRSFDNLLSKKKNKASSCPYRNRHSAAGRSITYYVLNELADIKSSKYS